MAKARISKSPAVPRASSPPNEIAVIGLARSGRAVAALLARSGNNVYASDVERTSQLDETASALEREGADVQLGGHDLERIAAASLVVVSPGVPPDAAPIEAAQAKGVDVVSEIEIGL